MAMKIRMAIVVIIATKITLVINSGHYFLNPLEANVSVILDHFPHFTKITIFYSLLESNSIIIASHFHERFFH